MYIVKFQSEILLIKVITIELACKIVKKYILSHEQGDNLIFDYTLETHDDRTDMQFNIYDNGQWEGTGDCVIYKLENHKIYDVNYLN